MLLTSIGDPPLCVAAGGKNSNIVRLLLEEGAIPSSTDENGKSGLYHSIEIQSMENTRLLLEAGAELEARDLGDKTPLISAVLSNTSDSLHIMRLLIKHGANVNATAHFGNSCLHMAVASKNVLKVQTLLESGAKMEVQGFGGDSVLHYAARKAWYCVDVLEALLAKHNDQGTLKDALAAGNDIGCTALHVAASGCYNAPVVKILLEYGASVEATQEDGDTPLHTAIEAVRDHGNKPRYDSFGGKLQEEVVDAAICEPIVMLLNAGADPRVTNRLGITPIELAINAPQFEAPHGMKSWHAERKAWLLGLDSEGFFTTTFEGSDEELLNKLRPSGGTNDAFYYRDRPT